MLDATPDQLLTWLQPALTAVVSFDRLRNLHLGRFTVDHLHGAGIHDRLAIGDGREKVAEDVVLALRVRPDSPALSANKCAPLAFANEVVLHVPALDATFAEPPSIPARRS